MRVRRWWLLAVVAPGIAIWGFDVYRSSSRASAAQNAQIRALQAETARLTETVAALQRGQQQNLHLQQSGATGDTPLSPELMARLFAAAQQQREAHPPEPGAVVRTEVEERQDLLQYGTYLDDRLARSPANDGTADALNRRITKYVDGNTELLDLACGKELCRIKTRHKSLEAYKTFQDNAFKQSDRLWSGPSTFVVLQEPNQTGGPLIAAVYLGRGDAMPSPAQ